MDNEALSDMFVDFYARSSKWGGAEVEYGLMETIESYIDSLENEIKRLRARLGTEEYKYGID